MAAAFISPALSEIAVPMGALSAAMAANVLAKLGMEGRLELAFTSAFDTVLGNGTDPVGNATNTLEAVGMLETTEGGGAKLASEFSSPANLDAVLSPQDVMAITDATTNDVIFSQFNAMFSESAAFTTDRLRADSKTFFLPGDLVHAMFAKTSRQFPTLFQIMGGTTGTAQGTAQIHYTTSAVAPFITGVRERVNTVFNDQRSTQEEMKLALEEKCALAAFACACIVANLSHQSKGVTPKTLKALNADFRTKLSRRHNRRITSLEKQLKVLEGKFAKDHARLKTFEMNNLGQAAACFAWGPQACLAYVAKCKTELLSKKCTLARQQKLLASIRLIERKMTSINVK